MHKTRALAVPPYARNTFSRVRRRQRKVLQVRDIVLRRDQF
jgi:hypothetical protein